MTHLTVYNFDNEIKKYPIVVVMFYEKHCSKCAFMRPVVEKMEHRYRGKIKFFYVDIEEQSGLARRFGAEELVPTFLMFREGEIESFMRGVIAEKVFERRIRELRY